MIRLEQLADEAITLRHTYIIGGAEHDDPDLETARRAARLALWRTRCPGLDDLAVTRETALGHLAEQGITPDAGCTVRAGSVQLDAARGWGPVAHRYRLTRGGEEIGLAWLSTDDGDAGPGRYTATTGRTRVYGDRLAEALLRLAQLIDTAERTEREALA